jgi:hypothetical protein
MTQAKSVQAYWYSTAIVVAVVVGLFSVISNSDASSAPQTTTTVNAGYVVAQATTTTTTVIPTTTTEVPLQFDAGDFIDEARNTHGECGEWYETAMDAGWQADEWDRLSRIMFRESRCQHDACSKSTSGLKCRDAGLLQVNQIHTKFLAQLGWVFPDDMFDPLNNLLFARRLYEGSGWKPWKATSGS